jgi:hypothetical protein
VTVTAVLAGVVALPPPTLIVWLESGGADPEGSVSARVQGVAARAPPPAIIAVIVATPPAGIADGLTTAATTELMRNAAIETEPPQLTDACADPAGVSPGKRNCILTEVLPEPEAGLVLTAGEVRITVPDGSSAKVPMQEVLAPGERPETVAVTSTDVCFEAVEGTGTTAGETVTDVTLCACTRCAARSMSVDRIMATASEGSQVRRIFGAPFPAGDSDREVGKPLGLTVAPYSGRPRISRGFPVAGRDR